jgi:poly-beta-hydroxyalkanoate depolymerase
MVDRLLHDTRFSMHGGANVLDNYVRWVSQFSKSTHPVVQAILGVCPPGVVIQIAVSLARRPAKRQFNLA